MYRFQGTDNVNNYICFGTTDNCGKNDNDIDKYMYRIIGITPNGELKLVKDTFVQEDNIKTFQWNDKYSSEDCGSNGELCTWPNSMLFKRLNGISNGEVKGTKGNSNIFIGNTYYEYLSNIMWLNKIIPKPWKYGDIESYDVGFSYNGDKYFSNENFPTNIEAKIGLMYLHDFAYAYKTNDDDAGNAGNDTNLLNAWIWFTHNPLNLFNISVYEWSITRSGRNNYDYTVWRADNVGGFNRNDTLSNGNYSVRPVFYVTRDIGIYGEGTKTNPFRIS